jgi:hypothetical protein
MMQACVFQKERPISIKEKSKQTSNEKQTANKIENLYTVYMGASTGKVPFQSLAIHWKGVWLPL